MGLEALLQTPARLGVEERTELGRGVTHSGLEFHRNPYRSVNCGGLAFLPSEVAMPDAPGRLVARLVPSEGPRNAATLASAPASVCQLGPAQVSLRGQEAEEAERPELQARPCCSIKCHPWNPFPSSKPPSTIQAPALDSTRLWHRFQLKPYPPLASRGSLSIAHSNTRLSALFGVFLYVFSSLSNSEVLEDIVQGMWWVLSKCLLNRFVLA
ncbi:uncharacterized protein LOC117975844 [Pan paniscus]|uniref:uncharacterized protein LOC117975844 n=1 Tax=Pan paniscus TaxID=9597 RepID=UPI00243745ED|nr:uncharacterized protein LOC117975844 [Pan paniscus]